MTDETWPPAALLLPEQAYVLAWLAARGRVSEKNVELRLRGEQDVSFFQSLPETAFGSAVQQRGEKSLLVEDRAAWAETLLGSEWARGGAFHWPQLSPASERAFLRGLWDATGKLARPSRSELRVEWRHVPRSVPQEKRQLGGAEPWEQSAESLVWQGVAALDVLGWLYEPLPGEEQTLAPWVRPKHWRRFRAWCQKIAGLGRSSEALPPVRVQLTRPDAVFPRKERVSDSGYDLTLLYEHSRRGAVTLYGTGIILEPPSGWYFDVVARSSITKRGYMLANNVGIIDRAYRGEILVPLIQVDPEAPPLELPARVAQLIPRPIVHFPFQLCESLSKTQRGSGGFGSTGL